MLWVPSPSNQKQMQCIYEHVFCCPAHVVGFAPFLWWKSRIFVIALLLSPSKCSSTILGSLRHHTVIKSYSYFCSCSLALFWVPWACYSRDCDFNFYFLPALCCLSICFSWSVCLHARVCVCVCVSLCTFQYVQAFELVSRRSRVWLRSLVCASIV